jgi:predicted XRE-type DNA-binding protein
MSILQSPKNDVLVGNDNVFDDLGFDENESMNLKIRTDLMLVLRMFIEEKGFSDQNAATFFGEDLGTIVDLLNGEIDAFSVDKLIFMLGKTGKTLDLVIH